MKAKQRAQVKTDSNRKKTKQHNKTQFVFGCIYITSSFPRVRSTSLTNFTHKKAYKGAPYIHPLPPLLPSPLPSHHLLFLRFGVFLLILLSINPIFLSLSVQSLLTLFLDDSGIDFDRFHDFSLFYLCI